MVQYCPKCAETGGNYLLTEYVMIIREGHVPLFTCGEHFYKRTDIGLSDLEEVDYSFVEKATEIRDLHGNKKDLEEITLDGDDF